MRITFKNREEWNDFMATFDGDKYYFAIKLDGSYELLSFKQLKKEFAEFPITIEADIDLMQICGVKYGDKVELCSFREMRKVAEKLHKETDEEVLMMSKVFSIHDWYDSGRRYEDVLSPYLTEKLMNSMKRKILTSGNANIKELT